MQDYRKYHKLICKIAWGMHRKTGIEVQEFISEFNVVFVESDKSFVKENHISFRKYLCGNIYRRFINIMTSLNNKRNANMVLTDDLPSTACYELMDSILIRDSFFNSKNPVILAIADIVCNDDLPNSSVKVWLRKKLYETGFKHQQITDAFSILREVIDPGGLC